MGLSITVSEKGENLTYHRIARAQAFKDVGEGQLEVLLLSYADKTSRDTNPCFSKKNNKFIFTKADHGSLDLDGNLSEQAYTLIKAGDYTGQAIDWSTATDE